MNKFIKSIIIVFVVAIAVSFFPAPTLSLGQLVKAKDSSAIYYIDEQGKRHAFPNLATYQSWYGHDFSKVQEVEREFLYNYPLSKNIVVRSGTFLIKIQTDPKVYAVEPGGILRHIKDYDIAETLFGVNWQQKIVDVPEVFWQNYTVGEPLKHYWQIPEGVAYQVKGEGTIYWKNNDIMRPFESIAVMQENGYDISNVITADNTYYARTRPITGLDQEVFNPIVEPYVDNRDCEAKNLKVAVIFVNNGAFTLDEINKITAIKNELPNYFSWASDELSKIDVSYPIISFIKDKYIVMTKNGQAELVKDEIGQAFYANNPDVFDFLIIFSNFDVLSKEVQADFTAVANAVSGIGKSLLNNGVFVASNGKLKGIINMGDINEYDISNLHGLNTVENYLLHEILHNWSAQVKFVDSQGIQRTDLLREKDLAHWNYYAGFLSPLGGSGWQANGDGTFTSQTSQMDDSAKKTFSDLDLYLMGLIPKQKVDPIMYLVPKTPGALGNTIEATAQYVDIQQIIDVNGEWQCVK